MIVYSIISFVNNRNVIKYDILSENSPYHLALQREISNALSFATSKGYQVHPDAFAMLKGLDTDILAYTGNHKNKN